MSPEAELNLPAAVSGTPSVRVIRKHHLLVRLSHWLNVPLLFGLVGSGISIYWASPVYQHKPDPTTGNFDFVADIGVWICRHVPGLKQYASPPDWVYNHFSLGPGMLAPALRLHFLFAYLFVINGGIYMVGLLVGGGWRAVLPRRTDVVGAFRMFRYYRILPFAKLARREWQPPLFDSLYNPLQRAAYFSIPVAGFLSAATGWAIHKPMQFHWLAVIFGGYNSARVIHFWLLWAYLSFILLHVILVLADGWDTLRSMIVGWSTRVERRNEAANEH